MQTCVFAVLRAIVEREIANRRFSPLQAVSLQCRICMIQNTRGILYAGAWLSYGFHEDSFMSGLCAVTNVIPDVHPLFEICGPD